METIGKKLKKNSVALDIVNFGEEDNAKPEKLDALLAAVNNNDTSHMVHVPPGPNALSDVLIRCDLLITLHFIRSFRLAVAPRISCFWNYVKLSISCSTPVFTGDGDGGSGFAAAAVAAAASSGASGFEFGVDPNIDPELALALRVSMEEERARQEAAAKRAAEEAARQEKGEESSSKAEDATMTNNVNASTPEENKKTTDDMVSICLISFLSYMFVFVNCHRGRVLCYQFAFL